MYDCKKCLCTDCLSTGGGSLFGNAGTSAAPATAAASGGGMFGGTGTMSNFAFGGAKTTAAAAPSFGAPASATAG
jgi:hypothetical protein